MNRDHSLYTWIGMLFIMLKFSLMIFLAVKTSAMKSPGAMVAVGQRKGPIPKSMICCYGIPKAIMDLNRQFRPYTQGTLERGLTAVKGDKYVLRKEGAGLDDWWAGREVQKILSPTAHENLKFNTQKPEGLLKRIIRGHSCPGDLVADFFCGTGTTGAVAEKLGRRWIMADASRLSSDNCI